MNEYGNLIVKFEILRVKKERIMVAKRDVV